MFAKSRPDHYGVDSLLLKILILVHKQLSGPGTLVRCSGTLSEGRGIGEDISCNGGVDPGVRVAFG